MTVSRAIAAAILTGSLLAPSLAYSKIGKEPNTPNVIVSEIGNNWIQIQSIGKNFNTNRHMHEVQELGDYACGFWDRRAVIMSQSSSSPNLRQLQAGIPQVITFYFLVACAIP